MSPFDTSCVLTTKKQVPNTYRHFDTNAISPHEPAIWNLRPALHLANFARSCRIVLGAGSGLVRGAVSSGLGPHYYHNSLFNACSCPCDASCALNIPVLFTTSSIVATSAATSSKTITNRQRFLATLGETCQKAAWQIHAWCLMRNNFHLKTPQANLVAGMKWLLGVYTNVERPADSSIFFASAALFFWSERVLRTSQHIKHIKSLDCTAIIAGGSSC
jgi:hypothetical protein